MTFAIPGSFAEYGPDDGTVGAVCPTCLTMWEPSESTADDASALSRVSEAIPPNEAGVAMVLATSLLLDSVAMNRTAILALFDAVQDRGYDPWIIVERLAAGPGGPELDRARRQLEQLADR